MISAYREEKWIEAIGHKEEGELTEYSFECEFGRIQYRFYKKNTDIVDGIEYYDIASYRGAEGPYIEWVNENKAEALLKLFLEDFVRYCSDNNIIAEFTKLDPWDEYASNTRKIMGAEYYGNYYCNDLRHNFYDEAYNRNAKRGIKKAIACGIKAEFDFKGKTIPEFVELYKNTEDKFHTSNYYRMSCKDIKKFFDVYHEDAFMINGVLDNKIITSVLVVMGPEIVHYLLLGSDPKYSKLQVNSLLTYETALYCQKKGKLLFDMGGGISGGGIERFKRNFINENGVWKYYAVKKIYNVKIYKQLVEMKGKIENEKFFPLYRG